MEKILFINACIRPESRTLTLAKHLLSHMKGDVEEVNLEKENIPALNTKRLAYKQQLLASEHFEDPMLRYARQFKEADTIVIAAPYYDLSFPSALKNYLEAICCVGLTFYYDEHERPQTLCRAQKLYYVSTGGGRLYKKYGFDYVKAVVGEFFHIWDVQGFFAERLDLVGSDPEDIMAWAMEDIDKAFRGSLYNKLVRDKIPDIIRAAGEIPEVQVLEEVPYIFSLYDKLDEEVAEYHGGGGLEELADILEVCFALAKTMDFTPEELLELCAKKRAKRGGFEDRLYLVSKEKP